MKFERIVQLICFALISMVFTACGSKDNPEGQNESTPPPTTSKHALTQAQTCSDIKTRIINTKTEQFLEHYYERGYYRGVDNAAGAERESAANDSGGDGGSSESPNDYTETNNQVEGVDEADIIKTDGDYIYAVRDNELLILKSWPPEETEITARYELGSEDFGTSSASSSTPTQPHRVKSQLNARALFLKQDKIGVFSTFHHHEQNENSPDVDFSGTRITILDVSERSNPELINQVDIEGHYLSGRMISGDVYVVSNSSVEVPQDVRIWELRDELENSIPDRPDDEATDEEREQLANQARPTVRSEISQKLSGTSALDMLPQKRNYDEDGNHTGSADLYSCQDLYLPPNISENGVLNISHFDLDEATDQIEITSTGLLAEGWEIYASQQNLYIALSSRAWAWGWGTDQQNSTQIHKFGFTGQNDRPEYKASGEVDGWLLDQFSMSEHDGHLRVATTDNEEETNPQTGDTEEVGGNHVIILEQNGQQLEETGSIRNLAPGERIYAVRMMGDKAYVVTFEQIDPLFTLDLSDPENPEKKGELKITGFSTYIHPLGDSHLMTIGRAGTEQGEIQGVQLQVFDVSDMTDPTKVHSETISTGRWSSHSEAMWEHHAFTYHPEKDVLAFPLNIHEWEENGGENFSGLVIYEANAEDGFDEIGRVDHGDLVDEDHHWWTRIRRSIFIEDYVYSYGEAGLKVNELRNPENEKAAVDFSN